jgi:beta-glucosidase
LGHDTRSSVFFVEQTRLGIPVDFTNEGLRGVCVYECHGFPSQLGRGHTWDSELVREIDASRAREARSLGYTNIYAPTLDVHARSSDWEESKTRTAKIHFLLAPRRRDVKGLQENYTLPRRRTQLRRYRRVEGRARGTARTIRKLRRASREHFMPPFAAAIKEAGLLGVMSSYNDFDGQPITAVSTG